MMLGGASREWKEAYRSSFSYRRLCDEILIVAVLCFVGLWLIILTTLTAVLFLAVIAITISLQIWGRKALWQHLPPHVQRVLPKEPLDAKGMPDAVRGYRDLLRAWMARPLP